VFFYLEDRFDKRTENNKSFENFLAI